MGHLRTARSHSGVGTGASIVGAKLTNFKTISNLYIDGTNKVTQGIVFFSTNTSITNSTVIYHSSLVTGSAAVCVRSAPGASNVSIIGCTLKNAGYIIMTGSDSSMSISNTLIDNCQYMCVYKDATLTLSGCTISNIQNGILFISSGTIGTVVLKDHNGSVGYGANFTGTKLYLISGSTLSCKATPKDNTSKFQAHTVSVGTFNGSEWVEGGTATFITKSGTTKHIWGTGTYIQMDGVTDLNSD